MGANERHRLSKGQHFVAIYKDFINRLERADRGHLVTHDAAHKRTSGTQNLLELSLDSNSNNIVIQHCFRVFCQKREARERERERESQLSLKERVERFGIERERERERNVPQSSSPHQCGRSSRAPLIDSDSSAKFLTPSLVSNSEDDGVGSSSVSDSSSELKSSS